jgi:hypothetical protein
VATLKKEVWVVIYCVLALIVLIVVLAIYNGAYLRNLSNDYILTSNGRITVNEDRMSLLIENRHNDSSRIIEIDGLEDISKTKIYSSSLRTQSGNTIKSHIASLSISESSGAVKFVLDTKLTQPASYEGWLLLRGQANQHVIPINVSSPPMLTQALMIVLIGSVSSIAFWEIIHFYDQKNTEEKNKKIEDKADDIFQNIVPNEPNYMKKRSLLIRATSLKLQRDATRSKEKSRYETAAGTAKMTFTAIGSSGFAIIVALLGLLNNDYLKGITFLNYQDIGVLFGLGFAAASLKELIVRS